MSERHFLQEAIDADPSRVPISAIMEAIRVLSEGVGRMAEQGAEHARILKGVGDTLHDVDKRLMLLEHGGVAPRVDDHERRLTVLEADKNRRDGAIGLSGWLVKNWPGALGWLALAAVLAEKGVINT